MPLIIVDGPEASGKSTLIRHISQVWYGTKTPDRVWQHFNTPLSDVGQFVGPLKTTLEMLSRNPDTLWLWEGSWLSHFAYQRLEGRQEPLPSAQLRELERTLVSAGGLLILTYAPVIVLAERRLSRSFEGMAGAHPLSPTLELDAFFRLSRKTLWKQVEMVGEPRDKAQSLVHLVRSRQSQN